MWKDKENLNRVLELTDKQEKAFNALKRAYKKCEKEGIFFANNYGCLMAFDSALVNDYTDDSFCSGDSAVYVELYGRTSSNCLNIVSQWTDDDHLLGLTEKGKEVYEQENCLDGE